MTQPIWMFGQILIGVTLRIGSFISRTHFQIDFKDEKNLIVWFILPVNSDKNQIDHCKLKYEIRHENIEV